MASSTTPPVFYVRGDSLNARRSMAGKVPGILTQNGGSIPSVVNSALTGMIGSSYIDLWHNSGSSGQRCALIYPGGNKWTGRAFSVLLRCRNNHLSGDWALWTTTGPSVGVVGQCGVMYPVSSLYTTTIYNDVQSDVHTQTDTSQAMTLNTFHDILYTCSGVTGAGGLRMYFDGASILNSSISANLDANKSPALTSLCLGYMQNRQQTGIYVEEFAAYDYEITDPTDVKLESGQGSLNGAARTSFLYAPVFDGLSWTTLAANKIKSGETQTQNGDVITGTFAGGTYSKGRIVNI